MTTTTKKKPRRGRPMVYDLGKYEVTYNTGAWSYCTANQQHYPSKVYAKGEIEEDNLPHCHCGARQAFGYPASVVRILDTVKVPGLEGLGIGGFRHVEHVERRSFKLKRQQLAYVQRMVKKYENRKR